MKDISKPTSVSPEEPVIYLEADEEITAATSRMLASASKEVRIVVPKRSTLLQSVVNQKLLKRAAERADKKLILVTTDRTASHLAAQVGIPVAATVKAEAAIPDSAAAPEVDTSDIVESAAEVAAVAAVAKVTATPKPAYAKPMMKSEPKVNNPFAPYNDELQETPAAVPAKAGKASKSKKNRNVPNFNELPKRVMIGFAALVAVVLLMVAQFYFKRASVTLFASGQLFDVNTNFKVDPNADSVSVTTATIPGKKYEKSSDLSGATAATGTKDAGTKAAGTITLSNHCYNPGTLATGTRFQSSSGLVFASTESVVVPDGSISAGSCNVKTVSIPVAAAANGDRYNLASTSYSNASMPSSGATYVRLTGSQMSGGTTKILKVVSQADIDKARADALERDKSDATKELNAKPASSQKIMPDSFTATPTEVVASPALDAEGDQVTVKFKVTYSILAVKKADLETLITAIEKKQVGANKQIYDSGVESGKITATNGAFNFVSVASAGEKIDTDALIEQVKGKRTGAATDIASKVPGVGRATISLWPSWSVKVPTILDHIKVDIKVEQKSKP